MKKRIKDKEFTDLRKHVKRQAKADPGFERTFARDALKKETTKKKKQELPIMFSAHANSFYGAPNNRSTKEANMRYELSELREHANALRALCGAIRKGDAGPFNEGVGQLARIGERRASDIHCNVNSIETLLNIRCL